MVSLRISLARGVPRGVRPGCRAWCNACPGDLREGGSLLAFVRDSVNDYRIGLIGQQSGAVRFRVASVRWGDRLLIALALAKSR